MKTIAHSIYPMKNLNLKHMLSIRCWCICVGWLQCSGTLNAPWMWISKFKQLLYWISTKSMRKLEFLEQFFFLTSLTGNANKASMQKIKSQICISVVICCYLLWQVGVIRVWNKEVLTRWWSIVTINGVEFEDSDD